MNHLSIDCRAMFRLHTLDLMPPQQTNPRLHWMLRRRNNGLRDWIAELAKGYGRLRRAGGDPFDGAPITGYGVLQALGLADRAEPQCLWEHVKAAGAMLVAATRTNNFIRSEIAYLALQQRRRP